jgi:hypothetical protein
MKRTRTIVITGGKRDESDAGYAEFIVSRFLAKPS